MQLTTSLFDNANTEIKNLGRDRIQHKSGHSRALSKNVIIFESFQNTPEKILWEILLFI